jgi:hypothetical protein
VRGWNAATITVLVGITVSAQGGGLTHTYSVGAGKVALMWRYLSLQKDCSPEGGIIKVHTRPQHGKLTQQPGLSTLEGYRFITSAPCIGKTGPSLNVYYTSDPNFHGTDGFTIEVIYLGHPADIDTFIVNVQ